MSDNEDQNLQGSSEAKSDEAAGPKFEIQKIYVKDVSFESPNSPKIFLEHKAPEVSQQLRNTSVKINESTHEVTMAITITVKHEDEIAYLIEIHQAGIFTFSGYNKEETGQLLGSYIPQIIFPFAREVVSDLAVRGGFPQLLLPAVNFTGIYEDHLKQMEEKAAQSRGEAPLDS